MTGNGAYGCKIRDRGLQDPSSIVVMTASQRCARSAPAVARQCRKRSPEGKCRCTGVVHRGSHSRTRCDRMRTAALSCRPCRDSLCSGEVEVSAVRMPRRKPPACASSGECSRQSRLLMLRTRWLWLMCAAPAAVGGGTLLAAERPRHQSTHRRRPSALTLVCRRQPTTGTGPRSGVVGQPTPRWKRACAASWRA